MSALDREPPLPEQPKKYTDGRTGRTLLLDWKQPISGRDITAPMVGRIEDRDSMVLREIPLDVWEAQGKTPPVMELEDGRLYEVVSKEDVQLIETPVRIEISPREGEPTEDPEVEEKAKTAEKSLERVDAALDLALKDFSEEERHALRQWIRENKNWPKIAELISKATSALETIESERLTGTNPERVSEMEEAFIEEIGAPLVELWRELESPEDKNKKEKRREQLQSELTALKIEKNQLIALYDDLTSAHRYESGVSKDPKKFHPSTEGGRERIMEVLKDIVRVGVKFSALQAEYMAEFKRIWPHSDDVLLPILEKSDGVPPGTYDPKEPGMRAYLDSMPEKELLKRIEQGAKRDEDRRKKEETKKRLEERAKGEGGEEKPLPNLNVIKAHDSFADAIGEIMSKGAPFYAGTHEKRRNAFLSQMEQLRLKTPETTDMENMIEDILFAGVGLIVDEGKVKNMDKTLSKRELAEIAKDIFTYKFKGDEKIFEVVRKLPSHIRDLERQEKNPNRRKVFKELRKKLERLKNSIA
ncbi:hypothetical protein K2Y00_00825 [Patescibacteria group bacterium]|nr:hypothetical protein [Patescibacteria group bacterium]